MDTKKYIFLLETTNWSDTTPHHVYILESNKSTKIVGYIPNNGKILYFFDKPMMFDKRKRTFQEINPCMDDYQIASPQ